MIPIDLCMIRIDPCMIVSADHLCPILEIYLRKPNSDLLKNSRKIHELKGSLSHPPNRAEDSAIGGRIGEPASKTQSCLRSEEHTSELQSRGHLVCRLLL